MTPETGGEKVNPPTIEHVSIKSVALNPDNPRQISSKQFSRLVKSLQDRPDLFEARPLLCSDRTGELIVLGGNMRLRAAQKLGYKEVPVIILRGLDLRAEKEIAIKDNGGFGEWDFDTLANEWSDLPLAEWGVEVPEWGADQPALQRVNEKKINQIVVDCDSEVDAKEKFEKISEVGIECRILTL